MLQLTVTIIQTNIRWEDKAANLQMLERKMADIGEKTEIVILPETFPTGFSMQPARLAETMDGEIVQWMKRIAREKEIILAGSLIIEESGNYFNRLVWMPPNGEYRVYDKRHRFRYGGESDQFAAGTKRLITSVNGWNVNLLVCYDLRFPVWSRQQLHDEKQGYDLLVYVSNWPERRAQAWKTLLQARAIENQCYVVGVNRVGIDGNNIHYSGNSMIVGPLGEILYLGPEEEDMFTVALDKDHVNSIREEFPFWRDADRFQLETGTQQPAS